MLPATIETSEATHAEQARELWSKDEKKHLRPGHFWACQLDDADGKGSPILHEFKKKNEHFELSNGEKVRGDPGERLLLLRCYYHRTQPRTRRASPSSAGWPRRARSSC